jgi:hypothetical protein
MATPIFLPCLCNFRTQSTLWGKVTSIVLVLPFLTPLWPQSISFQEHQHRHVYIYIICISYHSCFPSFLVYIMLLASIFIFKCVEDLFFSKKLCRLNFHVIFLQNLKVNIIFSGTVLINLEIYNVLHLYFFGIFLKEKMIKR